MYLLIFLNGLIAINALKSLELRIFNGVASDPDDRGYLVLLSIPFENFNKMKICSGSIISQKWVISAAHCFQPLSTESPIKTIIVRQYYEKVKRNLARVRPNNVFTHPEYIYDNTTKPKEHDISLLKTSQEIVFDEYAWSIDLTRRPPAINQMAVVAEYGANEHNEVTPREGVVKITKCPSNQQYGSLLCTYNKVKAGVGDSGGALTSRGNLVGVVSAVVTYCNKPQLNCTTLYVNVAAHYKWIRSIMTTK